MQLLHHNRRLLHGEPPPHRTPRSGRRRSSARRRWPRAAARWRARTRRGRVRGCVRQGDQIRQRSACSVRLRRCRSSCSAAVQQCGSAAVSRRRRASVGTPGVEVREREVDEAQGVDEVAEVEQEVVPLLRREYLRPPAQQQQHRRHVPERTCTGSDAVHVATRAGTMYAYRRRADARGHRGSLWAR